MIRAFQGATMALKYADVPVVVAPAGLALGGGCEIALHADRVQAAAETYIGLVEVGVGLIPAGGGTKEMLARAMEAAPAGGRRAAVRPAGVRDDRVREGLDERPRRAAPRLPARRGRHHDESRSAARRREGARRSRGRPNTCRPQPRSAIRVGGAGVLAALKLGVHLAHGAPGASAITTRSSAASSRGSSPAATRRIATHADRAAAAGPRARGVSEPLRRAQDPGTDRAHVEDGEAVKELTRSRSHEILVLGFFVLRSGSGTGPGP